MRHFLLLILMNFFTLTAQASIDTDKLLTVDQAFQVDGKAVNAKNFSLQWQIADGYHLYSDAIAVKVLAPANTQIATLKLPKGKKGDDPTRGDYMEYYHSINIPVHLIKGNTNNLQLEVSYQGCADAGLCFPPQTKTLTLTAHPIDTNAEPNENIISNKFLPIDLPPAHAHTAKEKSDGTDLNQIIHESTNADGITNLLQQQSEWIILLSFFVFGLLLAFTPCVFPMLPILSGIIARQGEHITSLRAFGLSSAYVLASALTYAIAGVFAGIAGQHLQSALQNNWVLAISGLIFFALSFSLFGLYTLQLPHWLQSKLTHASHHKSRSPWISTAIMGIFSTLIVSPCVSAPLVGALAYIGETGSPWVGGIALFAMGLGMGLPLLIIGTSAGKLLPKAGSWMGGIKNFFGVMLIVMAIWLWSRILPVSVTLALSGILAIVCAVYLGAVDATPQGWPRLWKAIGIIIGVYGLCLFVGTVSGSDNFLQPLDKLTARSDTETSCAPTQSSSFTLIHNQTELNSALKNHSISLLDFYADWCVSCKAMDREVFENPAVQQALQAKHIQLLRVDLTNPTPAIQALMDKYHIVAPPTVLFFNTENKVGDLVGEQSRDDFLQALGKI